MTRFSESVSFNKVLYAPASDAVAAETTDLGNLPEWNLGDLYPSADSAELKNDIEKAMKDAAAFEKRWKGKLGDEAVDCRKANT